jgi:hypothetical protein
MCTSYWHRQRYESLPYYAKNIKMYDSGSYCIHLIHCLSNAFEGRAVIGFALKWSMNSDALRFTATILPKLKALLHGGCDWFKPVLNLPCLHCSIHTLNRSSKKNWSGMLEVFICTVAGVSTRLCLIYLIGSFFWSSKMWKSMQMQCHKGIRS